jgi:glutathione S-transferase
VAKKKAAPKSAARKAKRPTLKASRRIAVAAKKSAERLAKGAAIKRKAGFAKAPAKKPDRLVLHAIHASLPSCKVGLMLAMLGVPWDYRHVDLQAGAHKRPQFLAMNRWGQVPVLQDGGAFITQSNVILRYLADKFGRFGGKTEAEKLRIAEWLAWDLDRLASGLGLTRLHARFYPEHDEVKRYLRQRGDTALAALDRHLGGSKFVAGMYPTIADIAIFPWIATADEGGFDIAGWPNVQAWAQRMLALPGVAHPYAIMPKEDRVAAPAAKARKGK